MAKVQISIDDKLLQRVDEFTEKTFSNRSSVFSLAVQNYMNTVALPGAMIDLASAMRSIAKSGSISEEDQKRLEAFASIAQVMRETNVT